MSSNNTNKLSPQELGENNLVDVTVQIIQINLALKNLYVPHFKLSIRSNNTNKLSPQEPKKEINIDTDSSNNTNKLSPQEHRR